MGRRLGTFGPGVIDAIGAWRKENHSTIGSMPPPPDKNRFPQGAPLVVGTPNGAPARLVRQEFYGFGARKGDEVWATGAGLDGEIALGNFTLLDRVTVDIFPGDTVEDVARRLIEAEHRAAVER
jgi:hypothetical protein